MRGLWRHGEVMRPALATLALVLSALPLGVIINDRTYRPHGKLRCLGRHDWHSTTPYTMTCRRCGAGTC